MTDIPPPPFTPPPPLPPADALPPFGEPEPLRTGPPWEEPGPLSRRFAETVQGALLQPTEFYRTMRRTGGIGKPVAYGLIGTVLGGLFGAVYQMLMSSLMPTFGGAEAVRQQAFMGMMSAGCVFVVLPFIAVVSMFVAAGIYHVMLLLLGGARFGFETTMRVVAYSSGSTSLIGLVPICGGPIGAVWGIVLNIIGLAQAHEIPTGKAAAAVLIPVVLCCVLGVLFYVAVIAAVIAGTAGAYHL